MTVQDLLVELYLNSGAEQSVDPYSYDGAGNPTFDFTSAGAVRGLAYLNRAYKTLGLWKRADGRLIKFSQFERYTYVKVTNLNALVHATVSDSLTLQLDTFDSTPTAAGDLRGWWVELGGEIFLVTASTAPTAGRITLTLDREVSIAAGEDATLYTRRWKLLPAGTSTWYFEGQAVIAEEGWPIVSVTDLNKVGAGQNQRLTLKKRNDLFLDTSFVRGYPTLWVQKENSLELNFPALADSLYKVDYYSQPEELTSASQEPLIPEGWHEILWVIGAALIAGARGDSQRKGEYMAQADALVLKQIQEMEHVTDSANAILEVLP